MCEKKQIGGNYRSITGKYQPITGKIQRDLFTLNKTNLLSKATSKHGCFIKNIDTWIFQIYQIYLTG